MVSIGHGAGRRAGVILSVLLEGPSVRASCDMRGLYARVFLNCVVCVFVSALCVAKQSLFADLGT